MKTEDQKTEGLGVLKKLINEDKQKCRLKSSKVIISPKQKPILPNQAHFLLRNSTVNPDLGGKEGSKVPLSDRLVPKLTLDQVSVQTGGSRQSSYLQKIEKGSSNSSSCLNPSAADQSSALEVNSHDGAKKKIVS